MPTDAEIALAAAESAAASATTAAEAAENAVQAVVGVYDTAFADLVGDPASDTSTALSASIDARSQRRFVIFGDSWAKDALDGVHIPTAALASFGGTIVANHAVAGSQLAPTTYGDEPTKRTDAQVTTAQADTSYDKATITDVLVIVGVNNIGGYLPTIAEAKGHFDAIGDLYPNARRCTPPTARRPSTTPVTATRGAGTPASSRARLWPDLRSPTTPQCGIGTPTTPPTGMRLRSAPTAT